MDSIRGASKVPIREEDKAKSYYHFYERELVEVPKNKIEILKDMYGQPGQALRSKTETRSEPGYLPDDFGGSGKLKAGGYVISNHTKFEGSTGNAPVVFRVASPRSFSVIPFGIRIIITDSN